MPAIIGALRAELSASVAKFVDDLGKARKALATTGKELERFGKDVKEAGEALTKLSAPVLAAGAGLVALAAHTAKTGDAIAKTAQEAGLSAERFQTLSFALGQVAQVEESQIRLALTTLAQRLGEAAQGSESARRAFEALGLSSQALRAGAVTTEQAFDALVERLQRTASASEATALASAVLGQGVGRTLGPALRASGSDLAALEAKARELGLVLSDDVLKAAAAFQDELGALQRQLAMIGHEVGAAVIPVLVDDLIPAFRQHVIPILRDLAEMVATAVKRFGELSPGAQGAALGIATAFAASGPALVGLGLLVEALGKATKAMTSFKAASLTAFAAAHPVITAITAAVVSLGVVLTRTQLMTELERLEDRAAGLRAVVAMSPQNALARAELEKLEAQIKALKDQLAEVEREGRRANVVVSQLGQNSGGTGATIAEVDQAMRDFEQATKAARVEFQLFGDEQAFLQANLSAAEAALKRLIDAGLTPTDERVQMLARSIRSLRDDLSRLGQLSELDKLAVQQAEETLAALEAAQKIAAEQAEAEKALRETALADLDAIWVQQAEATLAALDAQQRFEAQATDVIRSLEEHREALGRTAEAQRVYEALQRAGAGATAEQRARIAELVIEIDRLEQMQRALEDAGRSVGQVLGRGLQDAATGADTLEGALKRVADALIDIAFQFAVIQPLMKGFGSFFAGLAGGASGNAGVIIGQNLGGMAEGGHLSPGQAAVVGEEGMELFVPDVAGTIVPHDELAGLGGTTIFVDARGAGPGAGPEIVRAIQAAFAEAEVRLVNRVADEVLRGGRMRSVLRG